MVRMRPLQRSVVDVDAAECRARPHETVERRQTSLVSIWLDVFALRVQLVNANWSNVSNFWRHQVTRVYKAVSLANIVLT